MTSVHHDHNPTDAPRDHSGHGHSWMMIACCIPMLAIAVALVATGVVSPGFLVLAVACTAMMAVMMRGMHSGADHAADEPSPKSDPTHDHFTGRS